MNAGSCFLRTDVVQAQRSPCLAESAQKPLPPNPPLLLPEGFANPPHAVKQLIRQSCCLELPLQLLALVLLRQ